MPRAVRVLVDLILLALLGCDPGAAPVSTAAAVPDGGQGNAGASPVGPADAGVVDAGEAADGKEDAGAEAGAAVCAERDPPSRWASWPIPHAAGTGSHPHDYDSSAVDVVVDRVTGLVWQRRADPETRSWAEARSYCACLSLGGHDDWRLPTRMELVSIVDPGRSGPAIDGAAFPDTPSTWFWTSSTRADDPAFAWYIYFETGFTNFNEVEFTYRVRCVRDEGARGSEPPALRYRVADGTALDLATGLTWQQRLERVTRPFAESKAYCAALTLAGGGWRLPSVKELQSLIDDSRSSPSLDPIAFPDTPPEPFWTASPVVGTPGSAWRVSFAEGYTYDARDFYLYLARCVR